MKSKSGKFAASALATPGDNKNPTGRFAPSPTGPLHLGSLLSAIASYLDIKQRGGNWFVRMDDLDPPRQDPAASEQIITALHAHGLLGDTDIDYQSHHQQRYEKAFQALRDGLFYCNCSRRSLANTPLYPGKCRQRTEVQPDCAIRLRASNRVIAFDDGLMGHFSCQMARDYGDFIVKRRDGLWAYNFATAVDDGIDTTHVLRGQDLLHVTAQQIYVMQLLELAAPEYTHLPVLCFADGTKLSKQTHAPALDNAKAAANLRSALSYLGQEPPVAPNWTVSHWLNWGLSNWHLQKVPRQLEAFK
jgi:glutamyl-Q tRNA(Asp) synthetase